MAAGTWLELPLSAAPSETFRVSLDGEVYELTTRWNHRAQAWFADLADASSVALVSGIRLTLGVPLLEQHLHLAVPQGPLLLIDTSGKEADPGVDELGGRCKLLYRTTV